MLLQRLVEYQSRAPVVPDEEADLPPEYTFRAVPWIISIDTQGTSPAFIRTSSGRAKNDPGKRIVVPLLRRSGTHIMPQLLADTAEFVLNLPVRGDQARASVRHAEFVALVRACADATGLSQLRAVANFLEALKERPLEPPSDLKATEFVTFEVDGERPVDHEDVQKFWAQVTPRLGTRGLPQITRELVLSWVGQPEVGVVGTCLICGKQKEIARVHPVPIRLPRAVSDQALSIVTANKEAFWSYGLEQSYVAPICREHATAYARALNRLARDDRSRLVLGGAAFVFWTREKVEFDFFTHITNPDPEQVRSLLQAARSGRRVAEVDEDDTAFYATALSGSGGRAVVRDWIDTTVGEARRHLADWFHRQSLVDTQGEDGRPLGLRALAAATVRDLRDLAPPTPRALLRSALTGAPLPPSLLYQAVRRNRAEQAVTRPRATLIKMTLVSRHPDMEEDAMVQLDPENPNPAYRCGRLLAVLEQAQRAALPGVNATIVDRFYGTASSAPASVFPRLLRGAQPHLAKLERDRPGAYVALQRRLEDVMGGIGGGFPRTLTLEEQGLFALGYYHQRAFDRAQMRQSASGGRRAVLPEGKDRPEDVIEELDDTQENTEEES